MLATLCSYEISFGPYHAQTLTLLTRTGRAFHQAGDLDHARLLLERAVRDWARLHGRNHELRIQAIAELTHILVAQGEAQRAAAAQRQLLECLVESVGADHPDTVAARTDLAMMLFESDRHSPA